MGKACDMKCIEKGEEAASMDIPSRRKNQINRGDCGGWIQPYIPRLTNNEELYVVV